MAGGLAGHPTPSIDQQALRLASARQALASTYGLSSQHTPAWEAAGGMVRSRAAALTNRLISIYGPAAASGSSSPCRQEAQGDRGAASGGSSGVSGGGGGSRASVYSMGMRRRTSSSCSQGAAPQQQQQQQQQVEVGDGVLDGASSQPCGASPNSATR